jgi:hypothetical protein
VSDNSPVQATASLLEDGKEEGDVDTTCWEDMVSELPGVIDVAYLRLVKVHAVVPIAYCVDTKNINQMHSFVPAVMKRIGNAWEVLDDKEDELYKTIPWSGDNGITNNWGLYLRHPDKEWCSYFRRNQEYEEEREKQGHVEVSPKRVLARNSAHEYMKKLGTKVKGAFERRGRKEMICMVGEIVHVPLKDMDRSKTDPASLTSVIVKVNNGKSSACVAVKSGLLKDWYIYHKLGRVSGNSNNIALNGLTEAFKTWKTLPVIAERQAARNKSMTGGQGVFKCNCKGKCDTERCACKKTNQICTSACNGGNVCCENHE